MKYCELSEGQREFIEALDTQLHLADFKDDILMFRTEDITDVVFLNEDKETEPVEDEDNPLKMTFGQFFDYFKVSCGDCELHDEIAAAVSGDAKFKSRLERKFKTAKKKVPLRMMSLGFKMPDKRIRIRVSAYNRKKFVDSQVEMLIAEYKAKTEKK